MKEQLQLVIELMRKHVIKNLESIKGNETQIKEILLTPQSQERANSLNECYKYSKNLLAENNDFINMQVSMMNFINKYKSIIENETTVKVSSQSSAIQNNKLSRDDYFRLTIEKDISFDVNHPYFRDKDFYNDLFFYFQQNENYEMCSELVKFKS
jgi:hypothetical protein